MSAGTLAFRLHDGVYVLEGLLDELAAPALVSLREAFGGASAVVLDLGGIRRINSLGVRAWVDFMKTLAGRSVTYRRCSPAFVDQLNTVSDFRGTGKVESFLAPYVCESSGKFFYEELKVGKDITSGNFAALENRRCAECPEPLVFDDMPERYLHFLTIP